MLFSSILTITSNSKNLNYYIDLRYFEELCCYLVRLLHIAFMNSTATASSSSDQIGGKVTCRRNSSGWWVYYPVERAGKLARSRKRFKVEATALRFAEQKDQEIASHGVRFGTLPDEVRDAYKEYQEFVALLASKGLTALPFGVLVRQKLEALAAELMPGEYSVAEGIERFLEARMERLSSIGYHSLRTRLGHFARSLGNRSMQSITAEVIDEWLSGLSRQRNLDKESKTYEGKRLSAHSFNHYRAAIATFFVHALEQQWVTANPVKSVRRAMPYRNYEVLCPQQVVTLLLAARSARPSVFPLLVLQMFAGLRLLEAASINLDDICASEQATFQIPTSKTGIRVVPICDSLRAWLAISNNQSDVTISKSRAKLRRELDDVFSMAGFEIDIESARITYLRYRLEIIGDYAQLAAESGSRYALLDAIAQIPIVPRTAEEFFKLHPTIDR